MERDRPYVVSSVAMSVDGCIDDSTDTRLVLSDDTDLARVDAVRAGCDAILVGAGTVRADRPRLLIRSATHREERLARGQPPHPVKVTLTTIGDLEPSSPFFAEGDAPKLVYVPAAVADDVRRRLGGVGDVVPAGDPLDLGLLLADLWGRGVRRLLVEGGASVHRAFLGAGFVDELHVAVAPLLLGDAAAPRFFASGPRRMTLAEVTRVGGLAVLEYRFDGPGEAARPAGK